MLNLGDEFRRHLIEQFKENGERSLSYIDSAASIIENQEKVQFPKMAEVLAYCLREALISIVVSFQNLEKGRWKHITNEIIANYFSYKSAKGKPGENVTEYLDQLELSLEKLELFKASKPKNAELLKSLLLTQTGSEPLNTLAIQKFADVLDEASTALHKNVSMEAIIPLWERGIESLKILFLPFEERKSVIKQLARINNPSAKDLAELELLIATPHQAAIFYNEIRDFQWVEVLKEHWLINEASQDDFWPFMIAIEKFASTNPGEILDILQKIHLRNEFPRKLVLKASMLILPRSHTLVTEIVKKESSDPEIMWLAAYRLEDLDDESDLISHLCEYLLNPGAMEAIRYLDPLVEKIISSSNVNNYEKYLETVVNKIRNLQKTNNFTFLRIARTGTIFENVDVLFRDHMADLIKILLGIIAKMDPEVASRKMLEIFEPLPKDIRERVLPWYLGFGKDVEFDDLKIALETAISSRNPNGDDVALINRLKKVATSDELFNLVNTLFGKLPESVEIVSNIEDWESLDSKIKLKLQWMNLFADLIDISWQIFVLQSPLPIAGPAEADLLSSPMSGFSTGRSPISRDELLRIEPLQACDLVRNWRPAQSDFLISALELARTLMEVVEMKGSDWIKDPISICLHLTHPTYIHFYLEGILKYCQSSRLEDVDSLLKALGEIYSWDYEPEILGIKDGYSYESDWQGVRDAIIQLYKLLLDRDYGLGKHQVAIRNIFLEASSDSHLESNVFGDDIDPLTKAINRSSTKATEALISYMAYLSRSNLDIEEECFLHLEKLFKIENDNGLQYRAIILQRIGFLHFVSPDWFSQLAPSIFKAHETDDFGFKTFSMTLKMMPNVHDWFLQMFKVEIFSHVKAGSPRAMDFLLIGMLRDIDGYESDKIALLISNNQTATLKCGESLGRLLSVPSTTLDFVDRAVELWTKLLSLPNLTPELYLGFGWMSEVEALNNDKWMTLTLETFEKTDGRIDWIHGICERVKKEPINTLSLDIVFQLLRSKAQYWEKHQVAELGIHVLKQSDHLVESSEYGRLKSGLQERGYLA